MPVDEFRPRDNRGATRLHLEQQVLEGRWLRRRVFGEQPQPLFTGVFELCEAALGRGNGLAEACALVHRDNGVDALTAD